MIISVLLIVVVVIMLFLIGISFFILIMIMLVDLLTSECPVIDLFLILTTLGHFFVCFFRMIFFSFFVLSFYFTTQRPLAQIAHKVRRRVSRYGSNEVFFVFIAIIIFLGNFINAF